jgi:hypothetical protein
MKAVLLAQIVVAGIAVAVAILHFFLSFRHEARTLHRTFALFSLSAAGEAATSALRYRASSVEEFVSFARWGYTFQSLILITLLWFITFYTKPTPSGDEPGDISVNVLYRLVLVPVLEVRRSAESEVSGAWARALYPDGLSARSDGQLGSANAAVPLQLRLSRVCHVDELESG